MAELDWNEAALHDLLQSVDGPVGRWIAEKTIQMTALALAGAPLQKPKNFSWGKDSSSYMPRSMGYLKSSIKPHMGYTMRGQLFGGVNAADPPTMFLEKPAEQMHERIPFMTNALYAAMAD